MVPEVGRCKRQASPGLEVCSAHEFCEVRGCVAVVEVVYSGRHLCMRHHLDGGRADAVIVDVDGTLTIRRFGGSSRDVYRPEIWDPKARTPYEWDRVGEDPVNRDVVHVVESLRRAGHAVLVVSGRSDVCYVQTFDWLKRAGVRFDELFMAPDMDSVSGTPDHVVKRRIYEEKIEPRYRVRFVLDDRRQVVDMWRSLDLTVGQVRDGEF